jgi:cytochrome c
MKRVFALLSIAAILAVFLAAQAVADGGATYNKMCITCHGPDGTETKKSGGHPLKGLSAEDVQKKLSGYQDGTYGGPMKKVMQAMVKRLSPEDITEIAKYVSGF